MTSLELSTAAETARPAPPTPFTRLRGRLPAPVATAAVLGAAATALGTAAGLWFLPFAFGLAVGVWGRRRSTAPMLATAGLASGAGWALPLLWSALHGGSVSSTARIVAALAGLPPSPALVLLATLLVAALQAISAAGLARTVCHLSAAPARTEDVPPEDVDMGEDSTRRSS
ncbi:hypothetical protein SAMN05216223_11569 [Actinacidiphila yanglinensis]|uniref:Uncharacterized protein n=1 Tax=Actinacidiphila yanglinensis TaxID=310779 RepID=A0A1H6DHU9_9ACTN|nr:hypothetical protein [Actinacidiphila yanglinensis]SEG84403.1 hypothetical protein SAMN05216223_11569 [Actinacidiphila yanglinensis]